MARAARVLLALDLGHAERALVLRQASNPDCR